jgi:hypothetical protein
MSTAGLVLKSVAILLQCQTMGNPKIDAGNKLQVATLAHSYTIVYVEV